jgi:hypothetical protein
MPALIPRAFTDQHLALTWICSDCDVLFSLDSFPTGKQLRVADVRRINRLFRKHCKQKHPKGIVVELDVQEWGR